MLGKVIRRKPKQSPPKGNYAFIDSQNLNLGVQRMGWKMSWRKLIEFLREEYGVTKAFMFIGYMQENEDLYKQMHETGYHVILKPTLGMFEDSTANTDKEKSIDIKGNVDADLVLEAMKQWPNYDKAIIISGDGDFYGLIEHLANKKKLLHIMTPNWQYSSLLKEFESYIIRIDKLRNKLQHYDKKRNSKNSNKLQRSKAQKKSQNKKPISHTTSAKR